MIPALVSTFLLVPAADPPAKLSEAAEKELKQFQGKWTVTKEVTSDGETEPMPDGAPLVVEFVGRKVRLSRGGKFEFEVSALDPATVPKCLDLEFVVKPDLIPDGTVVEAIYKFDGETLTLAGYAGEGKKRPANFDPPKEAGVGVWVLKRVKE